jgi:L-threonylcarbamoyladenylate synthase
MPKLTASQAAQALAQGRVVAVPTETFYGLAADVTQPEAVAAVVRLKQRPPDAPIPVLVPSPAHLPALLDLGAAPLDPRARALMERFWPGALTLVLARPLPGLSPYVLGPGPSLGVRQDGHPALREVLDLLGRPVTGTSANLSGQPSLSRGLDADACFDGHPDYAGYVGEEPTPGQRASTVLELLDGHAPRVLRPGPVSLDQIEEALRALSL